MTRKMFFHIVTAAFVAMLILPFATNVLAVENYGLDTAAKKAYGSLPAVKTPVDVAGAIVGAILALLGIIFLIQVIIAGISWMTAQGNEEKIAAARGSIIQGAVGLVIVVAAYSLASYALTLARGAVGL